MAPKKKAQPRTGPGTGSVRVFVSWSGPQSRIVAEALRTWLPATLQSLDVFVSSQDLEKGVRWRSEINAQLATAHFGIACLTPQNVSAPWVHFEAGALAKAVESQEAEPPLFTYLIGIKPSDVKGPLSEFQHTVANKEDTRVLMQSLNKTVERVTGRSVAADSLDALFEVVWPKLEAALAQAGRVQPAAEVRRADDVLGEVLDLVRSIEKKLTDGTRKSAAQAFADRERLRPYVPLSLLGKAADDPELRHMLGLDEVQPTPQQLADTMRAAVKKGRTRQD